MAKFKITKEIHQLNSEHNTSGRGKPLFKTAVAEIQYISIFRVSVFHKAPYHCVELNLANMVCS